MERANSAANYISKSISYLESLKRANIKLSDEEKRALTSAKQALATSKATNVKLIRNPHPREANNQLLISLKIVTKTKFSSGGADRRAQEGHLIIPNSSLTDLKPLPSMGYSSNEFLALRLDRDHILGFYLPILGESAFYMVPFIRDERYVGGFKAFSLSEKTSSSYEKFKIAFRAYLKNYIESTGSRTTLLRTPFRVLKFFFTGRGSSNKMDAMGYFNVKLEAKDENAASETYSEGRSTTSEVISDDPKDQDDRLTQLLNQIDTTVNEAGDSHE